MAGGEGAPGRFIWGDRVILRVLDRLEEWIIATLIAAATVLIFLAVIHRYGTGLSIDLAKWGDAHSVPVIPVIARDIYTWLVSLDVSWAQELCIYMFIWMAKFGAAYGVRTGIHVGVDVLVNLLPPKNRKSVILFAILCGAFFTAIIAVFGIIFVSGMYSTGQQSNDLEAPMWIIYLAIPLGSALGARRELQELGLRAVFQQARSRDEEWVRSEERRAVAPQRALDAGEGDPADDVGALGWVPEPLELDGLDGAHEEVGQPDPPAEGVGVEEVQHPELGLQRIPHGDVIVGGGGR